MLVVSKKNHLFWSLIYGNVSSGFLVINTVDWSGKEGQKLHLTHFHKRGIEKRWFFRNQKWTFPYLQALKAYLTLELMSIEKIYFIFLYSGVNHLCRLFWFQLSAMAYYAFMDIYFSGHVKNVYPSILDDPYVIFSSCFLIHNHGSV